MGRKKRDDGALPFDMFSRGSGSAPPSAADEARRREDGGRIPDEVEYSEVRLDVARANYQIMTSYYHFAVVCVLDRNPDLANEACLSVSGLTADEVLERTEWAEDTAAVDHRIWNRSMLEMEQERPLREEQRMLTALQYDLFLEYVNQREPELADRALGYFLDESAAELASGISPEARERNRFPGEAQARLDELRREGGDVESLLKHDRDLELTLDELEAGEFLEMRIDDRNAARIDYEVMTASYHLAVDYVLDRNPDLANEACLSVSGLTGDEVLERTEWAESDAIGDEKIWDRGMPRTEQHPFFQAGRESSLREEQCMLTAVQYDLFLEYVNQREPELADRARGYSDRVSGYSLVKSIDEIVDRIPPEARERNCIPGGAEVRLDWLRHEGGNVESLLKYDRDTWEHFRERQDLADARCRYTSELGFYVDMVREAYERAPDIADAACLEISGLMAHESIERDSRFIETQYLDRLPSPAINYRTETELRKLAADTALAKRERFLDIVSSADPKLAFDIGKRSPGMTPTVTATQREHYRSILTYPGSGDRLIDACRATCGKVEERFRQEPDRAIGLSREIEPRGRFAEGMELER